MRKVFNDFVNVGGLEVPSNSDLRLFQKANRFYTRRVDGKESLIQTPIISSRLVSEADTTLTIDDAGTTVDMNSSIDRTVFIDTYANVPYKTHTWININRLGTGIVFISAPSGVTLNGTDGGIAMIDLQYCQLQLRMIDVDTWRVYGACANQMAVYQYEQCANVNFWTPSLMTTVAWWDASDLSSITDVSGAVTQLNDKSGNDRHMIQSNPSYRPVTGTRTINSNPAIEFDTSNWLEHTADAANVFPNGEVINIFTIASRDVSAREDMFFYVNSNPIPGVTTNDATWNGMGNGDQNYLEITMMFDDFQNNPRQNFQDHPNWYSISTPPEAYNTAEGGDVPLFIGTYDRLGASDEMNYWINSDIYADRENMNNNGNTATTVVLGGHGSLGSANRRLDGVIGEIIVTHGVLADSTRFRMEGYLAWKWGIVSQLPECHPYKIAPPLEA